MIVYDISYCQPAGTVSALAMTGADGIIIRNGYLGKTDTMFEKHISDALKCFRDKMIGSYTYVMADTTDDAETEAQQTISRLWPYKAQINMPIYVDMEAQKFCQKAKRSLNTAILMVEIEALRKAGFSIGVYTNQSFSTYYMDLECLRRQFPGLSLWLADYREKPYDPPMPVDLWQKGTSLVGRTEIDTNECYVDFCSRNKFFK